MLAQVDTSNVPGALSLAGGFLLLYLAFGLGRIIYYIYFHPLAKFPGPASNAGTYAADLLTLWKGQKAQNQKALHDKYGDVVRITPTQLSFNTSGAWRDIYGTRQGKRQISKDRHFYVADKRFGNSIIVVGDEAHTRIRRNLAHAFSDKALQSQEGILTGYFDLLVSRLKDKMVGQSSVIVDMTQWYNYATFDIIGDLTYGESFGALESGEYHPWIATIFKAIRFGRYIRIMKAYPVTNQILNLLMRFMPSFAKSRQAHMAYTTERVQKRMARETDRTDFMTYVLRHRDEKGMTKEEIRDTFSTLMVAGSETTATLLSGATYWLLRTPEVYKKLQDEVRNAFSDPEEITLNSTGQLPYLHAVLEESLRVYPPVPTLLPRNTYEHGEMIDGHYVPPNTTIGVHQYATYASSKNFANPEKFVPERWLPNPPEEYKHDDKAALQPFSTGPRNCIGKNLAYSEMRSILARMLWHFEWELMPDSLDWKNQQDFTLWSKPPLNVKLTAREV